MSATLTTGMALRQTKSMLCLLLCGSLLASVSSWAASPDLPALSEVSELQSSSNPIPTNAAQADDRTANSGNLAVITEDEITELGDVIDDEPATAMSSADNEDAVDASSTQEGVSADPSGVRFVPLNAISPNTLKSFVALVNLLRTDYYEPVNDEKLFADAMSGMLEKLDPNAEFLDKQSYQQLRAFTDGDVGHVGIQADYVVTTQHWVITQVDTGSPAAAAGIAVGDYLHQINNSKLTDSNSNNDVKQLLTGIAGTQVDVVVSKAGRRKRTHTLARTMTSKQQIRAQMQQGMAVIHLPVFQNSSRKQLLEALVRLDAPIHGLVIDVRNNPGGVLDAAVAVASLMMSDTTVVQVAGRDGIERVLRTRGTAHLADLPVVIIQNRYSASAAEVLASSLQDNRRAIIVGETSYGKGSIQSVIALNDEQAVKFTVAHYLTRKGVDIDKLGVTPDVSLQGDDSTWQQQAINILLSQPAHAGVRFAHQVINDSTETP